MITGVKAGDYGTRIFLDCEDDLSTATDQIIQAFRPDGLSVSWSAAIDGTGVAYTTQAGDIDQRGDWRLRVQVTFPSGRWYGDWETLRVE